MSELGLAEKVVRLDRALDRAAIPHAFGGALALAHYATPRATLDIDVNAFVAPEEYEIVAGALRWLRVERIPSEEDAVRDRHVRASWGATPIDVFFATNALHDAMRDGARAVPFAKTTIPILASEHLMVIKLAHDRHQDWIDVEQLLAAVPDLDTGEVRRWTERLGLATNDPRLLRFNALAAEPRGANKIA